MIKQRNACWQTTIKTHRHTRSTLANSLHVTIKQWKICDKTEKHLLVFENRVGGTSTFIYHSFVVARLQVLSAFVGGGGGGGVMEKTQHYYLPQFCRSQTPGTFCTCWFGGGGGGGGVWRKPSTVIYHDFVVARLQVLSALAGLPGGSVVLGPPVQFL